MGRTQDVPAEAMEGIVAALIAPYPARCEHGRGGMHVPHARFLSRLAYRISKVTTPTERHHHGLRERRAAARVDPENGIGTYTLSGHAARIVGAHERVDAIARRLRREGDPRTLDQLRSDIALDLILYGQLPAQVATLDPHTGRPRTSAPGAPEGVGADLGGDLSVYGTFAGLLPPAHVDVTLSLAALMGASAEPGTLACGNRQEWIAARFIRDMAFAAGSTWRRLVTDPLTGYLVDLTSTGYAVTGDLRERIFARDRISRAPGSMRPATSCDTDHDVDHAAGGLSSESNVSAKHRRALNHKTRTTWTSSRDGGINGVIAWTTPTGRVYETHPWDYRDPDPPTTAQMREHHAHAAAVHRGEVHEPDHGVADIRDDDEWLHHDLDLDRPPRPPGREPVILHSPIEQHLQARILDLRYPTHPLHIDIPHHTPEAQAPEHQTPEQGTNDPGPPPF